MRLFLNASRPAGDVDLDPGLRLDDVKIKGNSKMDPSFRWDDGA